MSKPRIEELDPNQIVRKGEGPKYFGLKSTALDDAIKAELIPAPFALTEGGRAKGWTGRQIIDHHNARIAASKTEVA